MKPTVPEVLPLVHRLYRGDDPCVPHHSGNVGGHLHIVLDDGNVERGHVQFCLDEARKDGCVTCIRIAELMIQMSPTQCGKLSDRAYPEKEPR